MSSIQGIPNVAQASVQAAAASHKAIAAPAVAKDSDGDFDGTKVGQSDAKDFGKGNAVDRQA